MTSVDQRRERVAAGSRRQRDLDAVSPEERTLSEQYGPELAWAKANLPNEYAPFVAVAVRAIRRGGGKATPETVMARLRHHGRTMEQLA